MLYPTIFFIVRSDGKSNRYQLEHRPEGLYMGCFDGSKHNENVNCFDMKHLELESFEYQGIFDAIVKDDQIVDNLMAKKVISALLYHLYTFNDVTTVYFDLDESKLWNGYKYYKIKTDNDIDVDEVDWEIITENEISYVLLVEGFFKST